MSGPDLPQTLLIDGRAPVPLPRGFHVAAVEPQGNGVRVDSVDGRSMVATPGQLAVFSRLLSAGVDDEHDSKAEAEFLDRAFRPAPDTLIPELLAPIEDPVFGRLTVQPPSAFGSTIEIEDARPLAPAVPATDHGFSFEFGSVSRDRLADLLPPARLMLSNLASIRTRAAEFVWQQGRDEDRAGTTWEAFDAALVLMGVVVYHSGDFGIELHDVTGQYFGDGYWPHIGFFADGTPAEWAVQA